MSFQLLLNNLEGHGTYYITSICVVLKLQRVHYRYRETGRGEGKGKWEEAKSCFFYLLAPAMGRSPMVKAAV
jgi:hypothetical protein